jgi:hypothetical protein
MLLTCKPSKLCAIYDLVVLSRIRAAGNLLSPCRVTGVPEGMPSRPSARTARAVKKTSLKAMAAFHLRSCREQPGARGGIKLEAKIRGIVTEQPWKNVWNHNDECQMI